MLQTFKAELFKALSHPVRIQILELLRTGEMTVSDLQAELGIEMSSVSQQLAVLRGRQLVVARREGTSVHYQVVDPQLFGLLDVARAVFDRHLVSLQAMANADRNGRQHLTTTGESGPEGPQRSRAETG